MKLLGSGGPPFCRCARLVLSFILENQLSQIFLNQAAGAAAAAFEPRSLDYCFLCLIIFPSTVPFYGFFFSLGLENLVTLKTEENVSSVTFFPHALVKVCLQYSMWVYYSVSLRNMYKSLNGLNLLLNLASSFTFYRNSILCSILVFLSLFLWVKGFVFPVYYSGFCLVG